MPQARCHVSPEEAAALRTHELHEKDGPTRARMQAVRLYGVGFVEHNHHQKQIGVLADAVEQQLWSQQFTSSFLEKYSGSLVCPFLE